MEGSLTSRFLRIQVVAEAAVAGIGIEAVAEIAVEVVVVEVVEEAEIAVPLVKEGMGNQRATQAILAEEGTNVKATSFS